MSIQASPIFKVSEIVETFCRSFSYIDGNREAAFNKKLQRLRDGTDKNDSEITKLIDLRLSFLSENDLEFAKTLRTEFYSFLSLYRNLVVNLDCDGFSRKQLAAILHAQFFLPQAAYSIRKIVALAEGPDIAEWGKDENPETASVLR